MQDNIYEIFDAFLTYFDLYPHAVPHHPGYSCDRLGNVYRPNGSKIEPFNSSGYKQVYMKDENNVRSIKGVHQVVAMTFNPDYFSGCVVHHRDENKLNNYDSNLEIESRNDHSRHHADRTRLKNWVIKNGPVNKGQKMPPEFCEQCRISALKRHECEKNE